MSQNNYKRASKITDHHNKNTNNFKILKYWENYQNVTQRQEVNKYCWKKWHQQMCLMQGCHKPSICKKKSALSETHNKMKCNKMRCACTMEHYLDSKEKAILSYSTTP